MFIVIFWKGQFVIEAFRNRYRYLSAHENVTWESENPNVDAKLQNLSNKRKSCHIFFTLISFGRRSRHARGIAGRGRMAVPRGVNLQSVSAVQGFQEGRSERLTTAFLAAHLAQVSPHAAFFGFVYKVVSHDPDYRARCWIMGAFPVSLIFHAMASPCSFFDVARRPCHKPEEAASGRSHAARCGC